MQGKQLAWLCYLSMFKNTPKHFQPLTFPKICTFLFVSSFKKQRETCSLVRFRGCRWIYIFYFIFTDIHLLISHPERQIVSIVPKTLNYPLNTLCVQFENFHNPIYSIEEWFNSLKVIV